MVVLVLFAVAVEGAESRIHPKLRVCVDYLNKNTDVRNTELKCKSFQREEVSCETFLDENGISNSTDKCERFFRVGSKIIQERQFISRDVTDQVSEWKLKKIDRMILRQAEEAGKIKDFVSGLSENDSLKFFSLNREVQRMLLGMSTSTAQDWLVTRELVIVAKPDFKKREISSERKTTSNARLTSARTSFKRAKNSYADNKVQFGNLKNRIANCNDDSSVCENIRNEIVVKGKEYVSNMMDMKINYLVQVRERISSSEVIDEELSQDIIIEIDENIDKLDALKSNLNTVETKDGLKDVVASLREVWGGARFKTYYHGMFLYAQRLENVVERSLYIEKKIDGSLGRLDEAGVFTEDIDENVELFSQKVELASGKINDAQLKLNSADDLVGSTLRQETYNARLLLLEARDYLLEANRLLNDILSDIRKSGGDLEEPDEGLDEGMVYDVVEADSNEE
jgi:hypothetical protein